MYTCYFFAVITRVLYTDYTYAVVYNCHGALTDDGYCDPDTAYVDIMARQREAPPSVKKILADVALKACYQPGDFLEVDHRSKSCLIFDDIE